MRLKPIQSLKLLPMLMLVAGLSSSCAGSGTVDFARPVTPEKQNWSQHLGDEWSIELEWWRRFGDPHLEALIETAVAGNADLAVLAARSDVAKAYISQAQAGLLPTIAAGGRTSTLNVQESPSYDYTSYGLGSEMSWELDVWGKTRRGIASQEAAYQSSLADWRAGHLALVSDVATAYLQLRLLDEQLRRQRDAIERSAEILEIYTEKHEQGLTPRTDVLRQRSELSAQRAGLIELQRSRELSVNGLNALLGEPAGNVRIPDTIGLMDIEAVKVPAGLPSEILSRRPDIVAAEYELLSVCNLEAQARLARLPSIGLTGIGGTAAYDLSDMFRTITGGVSSFVRFPVFDPAVRARIRVSEAQVGVAEEQYRAIVIRAFEEVENALTNVSKRKEQSVELEKRLHMLTTAEDDIQAQLEFGLVSYVDVLEGQRTRLDAEQQYLLNRWQILIDTVALFKAVGGGWPSEQVGS